MNSDAEKVAIFYATNNMMKIFTEPYISAIYGCEDAEGGELLGTGTFIELQGRPILLTAEHVVAQGSVYWNFAHSTVSANVPEVIANPVNCLTHPEDLAAVRVMLPKANLAQAIANNQHLQTGLSPKLHCKAIPAHFLANDSERLEGDVLFLHGYPGIKSRFFTFANGICSETLPYGTFVGTSSYDWFDPRIHIAIEYPLDGQRDELGRPVSLPDPHGLSGSALWKTN